MVCQCPCGGAQGVWRWEKPPWVSTLVVVSSFSLSGSLASLLGQAPLPSLSCLRGPFRGTYCGCSIVFNCLIGELQSWHQDVSAMRPQPALSLFSIGSQEPSAMLGNPLFHAFFHVVSEHLSNNFCSCFMPDAVLGLGCSHVH